MINVNFNIFTYEDQWSWKGLEIKNYITMGYNKFL